MKFTEFLQEEMQSSGNVIKLALKSANLGEEVVRLTKTKENTATENYRIDGNTVKAVWITEEGPMSTEGYSEKDGANKLERLLDGFTQQNGKLIKKGSTKPNDESIIEYDNFRIILETFRVNSAVDGSGFNRTYVRIIVE